MDRDEVFKRIREGVAPANRAESEDYLRAMGVPELPGSLTDMLHEAEEVEVAQALFARMLPLFLRTLHLVRSMQIRCGVCMVQKAEEPELADKLCPLCSAELVEFGDVVTAIAKLVRVSNAAYAPGSRATAQREARQERQAEKKASDPDASR